MAKSSGSYSTFRDFRDDKQLRQAQEDAYRSGDMILYNWLWCGQNLEMNKLKTVETTLDIRRSPPTILKSNVYCGDLQIPGIHNLPGSEVSLQHRHHHQKGPAEDIPSAPAQTCKSPVRLWTGDITADPSQPRHNQIKLFPFGTAYTVATSLGIVLHQEEPMAHCTSIRPVTCAQCEPALISEKNSASGGHAYSGVLWQMDLLCAGL
ncbi:unnamed protein product [Pleuronectes platessa]|uniref:Uncharacterized protein n=1 Tax=Pleuronectes platessa TaxID=8262 RepID=A0A9N7US14_PLEPL|nr:unnamed protein product [Pleuronectes platessa]